MKSSSITPGVRTWLTVLLVALLVWPFPEYTRAAVTIVDSDQSLASSGAGASPMALTLTTAAGDVVIGCAMEDGGGSTFAFDDDESVGGYTASTTADGSGPHVQMAYRLNVTGTGGDTALNVTYSSGTDNFRGIAAIVLRGVRTTAAVEDQENGNGDSGDTSLEPFGPLTLAGTGMVVACGIIQMTADLTPVSPLVTQQFDFSWSVIDFNLAAGPYAGAGFSPTMNASAGGNWAYTSAAFLELITATGCRGRMLGVLC